jgi:glycosyltransferase involved in cell wall biosynthesis
MGGAEVQINHTKKLLEKNYNLTIKLYNLWVDKIDQYQLLHIFNPCSFPIESNYLVNYSLANKVKVVISPIFWEYFKNAFIYYIYKTYLNYFAYLSNNSYYYLKKTFEVSDIILPNTEAEKNYLKKYFSISHDRFLTIPNGVSPTFKDGDPEVFKKKYGINNFILCVSNIYPRKNILNLIKAFNKSDLDTKLVIIGNDVDKKYYELCKYNSNKNTIFIPPLLHESDLLHSAYKSAKVVATPSLFETPGLAALEGGLAGANILITKNGGTKEYFKSYAYYVDPLNEKDIIKKLIESYHSPKNDSLSKHILNNYTWDKVAEQTVKAYNRIF